MTGVVTLVGFYVQDPDGASFLDGRYSGIAVVYKPADLVGRVPVPGTKVNIQGAYAEHGPMGGLLQKQVQASMVESMGETVAVTPYAILDVSTIAKGGADAAAYEGSLVSISEVQVSQQAAMTPTGEIFGALKQAAKASKSEPAVRSITQDLASAEQLSRELLSRLTALEERLTTQSRLAREAM